MQTSGCRLGSLLRTLAISRSPRQLRFSSSTAAPRRSWRFFSDDSEEGNSSAVYRHKLKFQRPSTIRWESELQNFTSFIGTVDLPVKIINSNEKFGVHTILKVQSSGESTRPFRILLMMWNLIGEIAEEHLKPNDLIYVSGHLGAYKKAYEYGEIRMRYKVTVKEINYVLARDQGTASKRAEQSASGDSVESALENRKNRLHMWQVFFASPHEWYDNRKCKLNPNQPDFKHKGTGEALWLSPNDPPWVRKQVQLYDSRLAVTRHEDQRYHLHLSPLEFDDWVRY